MNLRTLPMPLLGASIVAKHDYWLRFTQALLLYLPTLFFLNNRYLLGFVFFSLAVFSTKFERKDTPLFLFALYVIANTLYGVVSGDVQNFYILGSNGLLGGILLILLYLSARTLNITTLKFILTFICIEALAVYVQATFGIRVFFFAQLHDFVGVPYPPHEDLAAYFNMPVVCVRRLMELQPMGFSRSSLNVAVKLTLGLVLLATCPFKHWVRIILFIFLGGAMIMVYGRVTLIALAVFSLIWIIYELIKRRMGLKHLLLIAATLWAVSGMVQLAINICPEKTLLENFNLNRGLRLPDTVYPIVGKIVDSDDAPAPTPAPAPTGKNKIKESVPESTPPAKQYTFSELNIIDKIIMLAHRVEMWEAAAQGITESPFFGNHSVRKPVFEERYINNAYLSVLYVHGLVGVFLLAAFYFRRIWENRARFWLLVPLLIVNLTDDYLFWYLSMQDTIVIYILTLFQGSIFPMENQAAIPSDSISRADG